MLKTAPAAFVGLWKGKRGENLKMEIEQNNFSKIVEKNMLKYSKVVIGHSSYTVGLVRVLLTSDLLENQT